MEREPTPPPITSREYKIILEKTRFGKLKEASLAFKKELLKTCIALGGKVHKAQNDKRFESRNTWYLDTVDPPNALRENNLILRVREERKAGQDLYKLTLKYRGRDRNEAAKIETNVTVGTPDPKFEEDVTPKGQVFARSGSGEGIKKVDRPSLNTLEAAKEVFPGLKLLDLPDDTQLVKVCGFTADERVLKIGKYKFRELQINASLSFWFDPRLPDQSLPIIAEFSFDYDIAKGDRVDLDKYQAYPAPDPTDPDRLFKKLLEKKGWLPAETKTAETKTAHAYSTCPPEPAPA